MVLVGRSRTFQLMGCWIARGQVSCPRAAYKDFFEYWGVEGHRYMRFLEVGPDGETVDRLEQTVMRILGMDDEGNRVRRAHFGDAEAGEVSDPDGRASVEGVPRGRENGAQDAAAAESGAARAAAAVGGSGAAAAATVGGSDGDASAVVGESGAGAPATLGQSADRFGATPGNAGGAKDAAAAGRDGVTDAAFGEGSGGAGLLLADPEPASPPQPLLLGSFDQSWAAVRVPLMKKAVEASDEKYRRTGLSLLRPSPVLADYVDSGKNDTSAHKAPVLVEKEELALRWSGKVLVMGYEEGLDWHQPWCWAIRIVSSEGQGNLNSKNHADMC